ncbi:MAG: hypothetical protein U1D55_06380 [Phycisphaerae bacterium]
MMNRLLGVVAGLSLCCSLALAGDGDGCGAKAKDGATAKAGCCSKGDSAKCEGKGMPTMTYRVGDKETCCSQEAAKLAKDSKAETKYIVAGKTYADQGEAMTAYADALDGYMKDVMTVKYVVGDESLSCPMEAASLAKKNNGTVKYRLASATFDSQEKADKAAKAAKEAADKVSMKMMVGEKSFECPMSAADAAKASNGKVEYVIGDTKTCCDKTAKVELAKAKIKAAIAAIENTTKVAGA